MRRLIILIGFVFFGCFFDTGAAFGTLTDEIYIRVGAVTNLETCIAIAGDREAWKLLKKVSQPPRSQFSPASKYLEDNSKEPDAEKLIQELASFQDDRGYGTLWLCAHIVEAWSNHSFVQEWLQKFDRESQNKQRDDIILTGSGFDPTHNALVVSFADSNKQRIRVNGKYISRLLAAPKLLPSEYYGGIVLRDAVVEGPLVFNHATVTMRVNFTNVIFQGGEYSRAITRPITDNPVSQRYAVTIFGAHFYKRIGFYNSRFCSVTYIDKSRFDEALYFLNIETSVTNSSIGVCDDAQLKKEKNKTAIKIMQSHFDRGIFIAGKKSKISQLKCLTSSGYFDVRDVQFEGDFELEINNFQNLNILNSIFKSKFKIDSNKIDGDIDIDDIELELKNNIESESELKISHNIIKGMFRFVRKNKEEQKDFKLNFSNNIVNGDTKIEIPNYFDGEIDLTGGSFNGILTIEELQNKNETSKDERDKKSDDEYCSKISIGSNPKDHQVLVRLDAAKVHNLDWRLPIRCKYRWSGVGLTYDIWGDASKLENWRDLKAWRTTMANFEPDSLSMMADYLASHGRFNESRKILVEAKRLNYLSMCAPSKWLPVCTWENLSDFFSWDKLVSDKFEFDQFLNIAALVFLAPGGYGARPEFAMVWIFIVTALCWGIYCWYSYCRGSRYRPAYTKLQEFWRQLKEADKKNQQETSRFSNFKKEFEKSLEFHNPDFQPGRRPQDIRPLDEYEDELRKMANQLNVPLSPELNFHDLKVVFAGDTKIYGFSLFQATYKPISFGLLQYSIDTMVPVISLHAYSSYYPEYKWIRRLTVFQHLLGWWFLTVFLASATIL